VLNLTQMLWETVGGVVHVLDEHPVHSVLHPSSHSQTRDLLITNIVHVSILDPISSYLRRKQGGI
jgi:hypothetical protein